MKKVLLFAFAFFTTLTLQAELQYTNYGPDGWHISMNQNVIMDADADGISDFYINGYDNELGFVPIFIQGCFSSPSGTAYNIFGARELTIHQPGDIMDNSMNTFGFIDDERGSAYSANTNQLADGWEDGQDTYIGFFIFATGRFGWMKVALNLADNELILKELAYEDQPNAPIEIGYIGEPVQELPPYISGKQTSGSFPTVETVSTDELEKDLADLIISPNPASDRVQIYFDYQGTKNLSVVISNSVGQEVYRTQNNIPTGEINFEVNTSSWQSGVYFIQFQNQDGIKTEKLTVGR